MTMLIYSQTLNKIALCVQFDRGGADRLAHELRRVGTVRVVKSEPSVSVLIILVARVLHDRGRA